MAGGTERAELAKPEGYGLCCQVIGQVFRPGQVNSMAKFTVAGCELEGQANNRRERVAF